MSNLLEDSSIGDKLVGSGIAGLEKCSFSYGPGMQRQWVESFSMFLDHIGSRCGQSVKASLEAGEITVAEVDESILKKFDTEEQMKIYVASLKYWE